MKQNKININSTRAKTFNQNSKERKQGKKERERDTEGEKEMKKGRDGRKLHAYVLHHEDTKQFVLILYYSLHFSLSEYFQIYSNLHSLGYILLQKLF